MSIQHGREPAGLPLALRLLFTTRVHSDNGASQVFDATSTFFIQVGGRGGSSLSPDSAASAQDILVIGIVAVDSLVGTP